MGGVGSVNRKPVLGILMSLVLAVGLPATAFASPAGSTPRLAPMGTVVSGSPSPGRHAGHPFRHAPIHTPFTLKVKGQYYSANWGGFIDGATTSASGLTSDGASFGSVTASWAVPSLQPSSPNSYTASWDGIGGVLGSQALLQAGSIESFQGPRPTYVAFVEDYPNPALEVDAPVGAGDRLSASVADSGGSWTVTVSDATRGWSTGPLAIASIYASYGYTFDTPDQQTSEWIVEDPTCGRSLCAFANFTPETFQPVEDTATATVARTPIESIIVGAQGAPQVSISPSSLGATSAASASYPSFTVTRTGAAPAGGPKPKGGPTPPGGGPHR